LAQEGVSKVDVGRERFLEIAWEWKEKYGGEIVEQAEEAWRIVRTGKDSASPWTRCVLRQCGRCL